MKDIVSSLNVKLQCRPNWQFQFLEPCFEKFNLSHYFQQICNKGNRSTHLALQKAPVRTPNAVCQKYQDVLLHPVTFCSLQTSVNFWLFLPESPDGRQRPDYQLASSLTKSDISVTYSMYVSNTPIHSLYKQMCEQEGQSSKHCVMMK